MMGDRAREAEGTETHAAYSQTLLGDHFYASQLPEHNHVSEISHPETTQVPEDEGCVHEELRELSLQR